ncbi:glycosyltransferase [Aestuariirhabdus litorea]|nr:glycosyltransferase [Aestuariirhabdus litorea]
MNPYEDRFGVLTVYRPRFFSFPVVGKWLDPLFIALASYRTVKELAEGNSKVVLDAHFAFPDGVAAAYLQRWLHLHMVVTLRGTEIKHARYLSRRRLMRKALEEADAVVGVSNALLTAMEKLGFRLKRAERVGNGVDIQQFFPQIDADYRSTLGFNERDRLMITVGGLVPRKGQHIVIRLLPELLEEFPTLHYLLVGGASGEGDYRQQLEQLATELGVADHVHFLGTYTPDELRPCLSSADLFVLPTSNEGWANVILESMACGTPVVATNVGGNAEVISDPVAGMVVDYSPEAIAKGIREGLRSDWDRPAIVAYAQHNSWDTRVARLESLYDEIFSTDPEVGRCA